MQFRRIATAFVTLGVAFALSAAPASAHPRSTGLGDRSLAAVLTADGNRFDHNWNDYDIVTEAVLAVLAAKPSSAVGVLTDGKVALTAFLPTDRAFRSLVKDLTGKWYHSEEKVFTKLVEAVGVDTVEAVLLYHVVPGATITKKDARKADGAVLKTALAGATITVDVKWRWLPLIILVDADPDDRNPRIQRFDINRGNLQIAHGISEVLRPANL
ncbi:MAG: fasciclin domain-containing protein [Propionicimonas sp.]